MIWKKRERDGRPAPLPCLLFLALLFFGGVLLGQVLAGRVPDATGDELGRYLTDYFRLGGGIGHAAGAIPSTAIIYFRYPLLAFLLGFTSLGILLLPCVTVAYGFFLSFSVCCFTAAFGVDGILLAFAVFGLRCMLTLPCYLLLAVSSWGSSAALAKLSFGRGKRVVPVIYGRDCWIRFIGAVIVLLVGICVDLFLSPRLLQAVLEQILL